MKRVTGKVANPGLVKGRAVLVRSVNDLKRVKKGDVLISHHTIPAMIVAMDKCAGVVTEVGGTTSHAAIVTRELGIPCIVGAHEALKIFHDGDLVVLDAFKGEFYEVSKEQYKEIKQKIPSYKKSRQQERKGPATARQEWILSLHDVTEDDRSIVGGKASRLGELSKDFSVPAGFVITTAVFSEMIEGLNVPSNDLQAKVEHLQEAVREAPIGKDVLKEIKSHFDKLGKPVAVRSSAVHEDGFEASFAGQHDSILNVDSFEGLITAIKKVCASTFTERAIAYFSKHKLRVSDAKMAVLIQEMLQADYSGVAFSAHPVKMSADEIVVEMVSGLGDKLVSGEATPEEFVFDKATCTPLEKKASTKTSLIALQAARVAKSAELYFNQAQDIEWAYKDDKIFLLQSRDITSYRLPEFNRYLNFIENCFGDYRADESWPLLAGQINTYFDVDEAFEWQMMLQKISERDHKNIRSILPRQVCLKQAMLQNGIVGLKVAHLLGIKKFSVAQLQMHLQGMLDLVKHAQRNDPFSNKVAQMWDKKEISDALKKSFITTSDTRELAHLISLADALTYATYYDLFIAGGLDRHGPYDASGQFGPEAKLLVYEYYDMKPLEIWPQLKDLKYKHVRICLIYKGKRARIDGLGRPILEPGFMDGVIAFHVESEPRASIRELIKDLAPWVERQTSEVESLSDLDKMRKGALLYHYTLKPLRQALLGYWKPKGVEEVIDRLGDELIKKFGPSTKKPINFNILFDPRTLELGEE